MNSHTVKAFNFNVFISVCSGNPLERRTNYCLGFPVHSHRLFSPLFLDFKNKRIGITIDKTFKFRIEFR